MDRKTYEFPLRLKSIEENGYFAGYASVFNVEDSHNDIIRSNSGDSLITSYLSEAYLPSRVDVNFINRENNYGIGTTSDGRDSISKSQVYEANYPLVLTGPKAKTISEIALAENWISRKSYNFALPINLIKVDIGDVINLERSNGDIEQIKVEKIRLKKTAIDISGSNIEKSIYGLLGYEDFESTGNTVAITPDIETISEIMDISSLAGDDMNTAYLRFAIAGAGNAWEGAEIFYSQGTTNYQSLGSVQIPATMGNVADELPDANSFIWDEVNEIEVYLVNGTLSGVTSDDVLNGSNLALVGDEIIQFREAEFVEEGRYMIRGLLRGRMGTENKTSTHVAGERFVLLNQFIFKVEMQKSLIGSSLNIKVVTFGKNINDVEPVNIIYMAQNLAPYPVAHFEAEKDSATGDISFSWIRRSREFSAWRDYIDMPLSESVEQYNISILNISDQIVREIDVNTNSYNYTEALQIEDFGASQNSIKAMVYQFSENVGIGQEVEEAFSF